MFQVPHGALLPPPLPSVVIADNADFNIFTLAELFAFRCNYEARYSLLRAAPRNAGRIRNTLRGWGRSEAGQSGPGRAELCTPAFQRKCPDWYSPHSSPALSLGGSGLFCSSQDGEQCSWWWKWVRAVSSQSLLCVSGTVLVPGSWAQGAYMPLGDTDKKKLTR